MYRNSCESLKRILQCWTRKEEAAENLRQAKSMSLMLQKKMTASPKRSLRYVALQSGISKDTITRILKQQHFHPYKIHHLHTMSDRDPHLRLTFCEWMSERLEQDSEFSRRVMFSDECLFFMDGHAHTQNARYWSQTNPGWMRQANNPGAEKVMV